MSITSSGAFDPHLEIGERVEFSKTLTETDLVLFAGLTGDFDPVHMNEAYARTTAFGRRILHGGLIMGLISTTASMISQRSIARGASGVPVSLGYDKIRILAPAFPGDTLTARYTVEEIDRTTRRSRSKVEVVKVETNELCLVGHHVLKWVSK